MAISNDEIEFYIEQLSEFGEVRPKRMFGGVGLFHNDVMFGMIGSEVFRLRADELTQGDYEAEGMDHLKKGKGTMPYWQVPERVLSDRSELAVWAKKAFEAALRGKKK